EHPEKIIDAIDLQFVTSVPEDLLLLVGQIYISAMDREIGLVGILNELRPPFTHLFPSPALYALLLEREAFVGDDQVLIDTHDLAELFTFRTGPGGTVKVEHHFRGLLDYDAVGLTTI